MFVIMFCRHINNKRVSLEPARPRDSLDDLVDETLEVLNRDLDTWSNESTEMSLIKLFRLEFPENLKLPELYAPGCPTLRVAIEAVVKMDPPHGIRDVIRLDRSFALGLVELFVTRYSQYVHCTDSWT